MRRARRSVGTRSASSANRWTRAATWTAPHCPASGANGRAGRRCPNVASSPVSTSASVAGPGAMVERFRVVAQADALATGGRLGDHAQRPAQEKKLGDDARVRPVGHGTAGVRSVAEDGLATRVWKVGSRASLRLALGAGRRRHPEGQSGEGAPPHRPDDHARCHVLGRVEVDVAAGAVDDAVRDGQLDRLAARRRGEASVRCRG